MATRGRGSERSHAPLTNEHLKRLVKIAREDQEALFERKGHLVVYESRLLLVALCQGAAVHYVDCLKGAKKTNGVKDLDVYSFYAKDPRVPWPYRRHGKAEFGESEFGSYYDAGRPYEYKGKRFVGRPIDLMGRALPVGPDANPIKAVRAWLATSDNPTPRHLRLKAVVGLYPAQYQGKVIWDRDVDI